MLVGILLTIGRWYNVIDNSFILINYNIQAHISNFSLSLMFYLCVGYIWLLYGVKFRFIVALGLFLIAANFICETVMGFMNTPDIIDAIYGAIGIAVAFIFLSVVNKCGLVFITVTKES
jgi:hypothetical protein